MMAWTKKRAGIGRATSVLGLVVGLLIAASACTSDPTESDPYGSTEEETQGEQYGESDSTSPSEQDRPDGLPDEMPLPDYAAFWFDLEFESHTLLLFQADVPVAVLIEDMERLLAENGWETVNRVEQVAWGNDVLLRVEGHGHDMDVHIQPLDGSDTESQVVFGPGGSSL